jgi:hypothetical protein
MTHTERDRCPVPAAASFAAAVDRRRPSGRRGRPGSTLSFLFTLVAVLLAVPGAAGAQATAPAAPTIRLSGDVATRAEYVANENFAETDEVRADDHRFRVRNRVRLSGVVPLTERIEAGLRVSTGDPAYPPSAWVTPSEFRRMPIQIDRAYLSARVTDAVTLRVGTHANPLFTPTELVWDSDVQPSGLAQVLRPFGQRLTVTAGQFAIRETRSVRDANAQSAYLFAQGVTYALPVGGATAVVGVSNYYFHNPDVVARSLQLGELDGEFRTNRFDPRGRTAPDPRGGTLPIDYFSGYNILNGGVRAELAALPLSIGADVAVNLAARREADLGPRFDSRENLGFGAMVRYGALRQPGDRSFGIGYFHIETDAVLAVFNSDDLQQTNIRSVPIELQLVLPGRVRLVWDSYLQRKLDTMHASNGGVFHGENALKVRSRISASASF